LHIFDGQTNKETIMTTLELKETVAQLKGYNVVDVDFSVNTFTTDKKCVYAFDLTRTGLLKANSINFMWTASDFKNCSY
jgi:hypothetical protein